MALRTGGQTEHQISFQGGPALEDPTWEVKVDATSPCRRPRGPGVAVGVAWRLGVRDRERDDTRARLQGSSRRTSGHYISTVTLILLLGLYIWMLERRWPIPNLRSAFKIGATGSCSRRYSISASATS